MKRLRPWLAAIAAISFTPLAVVAAEPADEAELKFNIMGSASCARWPTSGAITAGAKAVPLNWVLGFLSGTAAETNMARLEFIEPDAVAGWLDSYCRDYPDAPLPRAARAYELALEERLNPPPPPPIVLSDPKPKPAPKAPARPRR
jgi:hypothetical protein